MLSPYFGGVLKLKGFGVQNEDGRLFKQVLDFLFMALCRETHKYIAALTMVMSTTATMKTPQPIPIAPPMLKLAKSDSGSLSKIQSKQLHEG